MASPSESPSYYTVVALGEACGGCMALAAQMKGMGKAAVPQAVVAALWLLGLTAHPAASVASRPPPGLATGATPAD